MFNKRVTLNFIANLLYQMSLLLLPLIVSPYLTRALGAEALGRYQYANSVTYYFCIFCILGIATYGNRECAIVRDERKKLTDIFWGIYGIQLLASMGVIGVYSAYIFCGGGGDVTMAILQIPQILSCALDITWIYYGMEQFYKIALRNFVIKVVSVLLIFLLVKTAGDVYIYCLIMTGTLMLSQLALWPFVFHYIDKKRICLADMRPHVRQVLLLFLPVVGISIYAGIDKIMIGNMISKSDVAVYAYAENLSKLPVGIVTALTTVMLPRVSKMVAENQADASRKLTRTTMQVTMFLALPIALGIAAIADKMVPWFYAEDFLECIPLIKMLVVIIVFIAWTYVVQNQCLVPLHRDHVLVKSALLTALVNILANMLLIPRYGIQGAAVGTICSELIVVVYKTSHCRGELPIWQMVKDNVGILLAALVMYVAVWYTGEWIGVAAMSTTMLQIGVGVCVYGILGGAYILVKRKKRSL